MNRFHGMDYLISLTGSQRRAIFFCRYAIATDVTIGKPTAGKRARYKCNYKQVYGRTEYQFRQCGADQHTAF